MPVYEMVLWCNVSFCFACFSEHQICLLFYGAILYHFLLSSLMDSHGATNDFYSICRYLKCSKLDQTKSQTSHPEDCSFHKFHKDFRDYIATNFRMVNQGCQHLFWFPNLATNTGYKVMLNQVFHCRTPFRLWQLLRSIECPKIRMNSFSSSFFNCRCGSRCWSCDKCISWEVRKWMPVDQVFCFLFQYFRVNVVYGWLSNMFLWELHHRGEPAYSAICPHFESLIWFSLLSFHVLTLSWLVLNSEVFAVLNIFEHRPRSVTRIRGFNGFKACTTGI